MFALAVILDGGSRSEAARIAGVTLQVVRDWVLKFNEGGPGGLATRKAPGKASILNDEQRARLAEQVEMGPIPAAHGVVRWRLVDLGQWVWDEFGLSVTRFTLDREPRAMGYRKLSARPRGLSGFPCVGGHNGYEEFPLCHDAKNRRYRTICSISCWRAARRVRPLNKVACWILRRRR